MHIRSLIKNPFPRRLFTSDEVLVWSVCILVFSLLAAILFDGYVFYRTFFRPSDTVQVAHAQTLTSADIDAVIAILNERQTQFNTLIAPRKK